MASIFSIYLRYFTKMRDGKGKVMIVDDTPANLQVLFEYLQAEHYRVLVSEDALSALEQLRYCLPDIILLDVMMPEMDGFEACQRIKTNPNTCSIPVIFMTALTKTEDKVKAFELGAVDFISKPIQYDEMLARVKTHITMSQLQRELKEKNAILQKRVEEHQHTLLALKQERANSERLLSNVLPKVIADRLKRNQRAIAQRFEDVTILFADIVDFTEIAASISAGETVKHLNDIFSIFDQLADEFGVEKIKTIGDAYMAVGGLPLPRDDHAIAVVEMALAMQSAIDEFHTLNGRPFQLRIGIHSGPAVAGVIGKRRFIYDLWGDSVNVASRLEDYGVPGEIQISEAVRNHISSDFITEERRLENVKGKGEMITYLLKGRQSIKKNLIAKN